MRITPRAIPAALRSAVLDTLRSMERRDRVRYPYEVRPFPGVLRLLESGAITRRLARIPAAAETLALWRRADRLIRYRVVRRILREAGEL